MQMPAEHRFLPLGKEPDGSVFDVNGFRNVMVKTIFPIDSMKEIQLKNQ
jgi:hypothetical protein